MDSRLSRTGQIRVYLGKCFRIFKYERQWKNFISTGVIIILVCMVTGEGMFQNYEDTRTGMFAVVSACIWVGLFNSIQSICRERAIIKREYRTGLSISSYIFAHAIFELFQCTIQAFIILVILLVRNFNHLPPEGLILPMPVDLYITLFLVTFASDMIALLISSTVKNENSAMTVMPFILIIQLVMSGVVFELQGVPKLISYLTISRWGVNASCSISATHSRIDMETSFLQEEGIGAEPGNLLIAWLVILLFSAIYTLLAIVMLRRVDRDQR